MDRKLNILLKILGKEKIEEIDSYVRDISSLSFYEFETREQVVNNFLDKMDSFYGSLNEVELMDLRSYTGYNFKNINAILRGNWNYEENGYLDKDVEIKYRELSLNIQSIIDKFPKPDINFVTYRGIEFSYFSKYGITSLEQLVDMKDKFIYEEGFTSTSILKDTSYFGKNLDTGKNYNVEIKYLISSDTQDGALLLNNDFSYSPNQNEFLINAGSLSKVIDVSIDLERNTARLEVVLVPKKMWDTYQPKSTKVDEEKPRSY